MEFLAALTQGFKLALRDPQGAIAHSPAAASWPSWGQRRHRLPHGLGVRGVSVDLLAGLDVREWLGLGLRWFHVIVAMGWIGASLYFMWLDATLAPPSPPRPGVEGDLWMVHSGGFYRVEKRRLGAGEVPTPLHWFKWEAGLTWLSGASLLGLVYYTTGGVYLVDPAVSALTPAAGAALGVGVLAAGWAVYDALWVSPLAARRPALTAGLSWALLLGLAWGLCRALSGRGAYIHVGAVMGTVMVANVWMRIIPAQRQLVAATQAGQRPDPTLGARAKQRSVHNSYLTFPAIFTMLSHHYPSTYGHPRSWLVLALLVAVGAGVRHVMIRHEHRGRARWTVAAVAACVLALLYLTSPAGLGARGPAAGGHPATFRVARQIVDSRCVSCHSRAPTDDVFRAAPNGVAFDTPQSLRAHADAIKARVLVLRTMPLGNKTGMTDEERVLLGRWVDEGARLE
ncbi:MAG TPA: urate hydroxylase PuuD [Methylomirabilota bacterium]|nr:urate hydroxylase PuuD [Methylomirabilota bacterium]